MVRIRVPVHGGGPRREQFRSANVQQVVDNRLDIARGKWRLRVVLDRTERLSVGAHFVTRQKRKNSDPTVRFRAEDPFDVAAELQTLPPFDIAARAAVEPAPDLAEQLC